MSDDAEEADMSDADKRMQTRGMQTRGMYEMQTKGSQMNGEEKRRPYMLLSAHAHKDRHKRREGLTCCCQH